jgi:pyruvate/2-oxoglutarate dehydrogenase complex dihydrolipoamide acyltransferase (E2) component
MNPYERTAAEMKRQGEGPKRFVQGAAKLGTAAGAAVGAASFAPILARAAPFLSQYIPEDLAIKGLSKINPKLGKFVKDAIDGGYDFGQVKDFIGQQITESTSPTPAKENRNVIEQHSPELNTFLSEKIKGGEDPVRAAALALFEKGNPFEPVIRKIEKEHKTNWSQLVQSIYGGGQSQEQQQQQPQGQQQRGISPQVQEALQKIMQM